MCKHKAIRGRIAGLMAAALVATAAYVPALAVSDTAENTHFYDVPASSWYYDVVQRCASDGIVNGYPDGSFCPEGDVTVAEALTMVYRALGVDMSGTKQLNSFWGSGIVDYALCHSTVATSACQYYTSLNNEGRLFYVENLGGEEATRKMVAKMLIAQIGLAPVSYNEYAYQNVTDWAEAFSDPDYAMYVGTAWAYGILNGDAHGCLSANEHITRAELCQMITNIRKNGVVVTREPNSSENYFQIDMRSGIVEDTYPALQVANQTIQKYLSQGYINMLREHALEIHIGVVSPIESGGVNAVGMCTMGYDRKVVIWAEPEQLDKTLLHELGHALSSLYMLKEAGQENYRGEISESDSAFHEIYDAEMDSFRQYLSIYSAQQVQYLTSSISEYWAGIFEQMLRNGDALAQYCPRSYAYVKAQYDSFNDYRFTGVRLDDIWSEAE